MADVHPLDQSAYPEPAILRQKIVTSFGNIIKNLSNIDVISDTLISQRVFSFDDSKRVNNEKTEEARARELLYVLDKKPDHGVVAFMEALMADNSHIHDMILAATDDAKPYPVSQTLAEQETLRVFLEACTSRCLCPDPSGCLDVPLVTEYIQQQCTNSGLPHQVTHEDVIETVINKFKVTIHRPQMYHVPDQILGLSWKPEIRDKLEQVHMKLPDQTLPIQDTDEVDGDVTGLGHTWIRTEPGMDGDMTGLGPIWIRTEPEVVVQSVESDTIQLLTEQLHAMITRDVSSAMKFLGRMSQVDRKRVATQLIGHKNALCKALQVHSYNLMVYLIEECGADVNQYTIPAKTTEKTTILTQAASSNKLEIVKLLLKHGADINKANEKGNPMIPAVLSKRSLNREACNFDYSDIIGMTPVMQTCQAGFTEMVQYLVKAGADINLADRHGRTCLMAAIRSPDITSYILSLGGDVDAQDDNGDTALHWAVKQNLSTSIQLLLKNRAEVNTWNTSGNTALHLAILNDSVDVVRELLDHGADPYKRNKSKEDALLLAVLNDRDVLVDLLVDYHKANTSAHV